MCLTVSDIYIHTYIILHAFSPSRQAETTVTRISITVALPVIALKHVPVVSLAQSVKTLRNRTVALLTLRLSGKSKSMVALLPWTSYLNKSCYWAVLLLISINTSIRSRTFIYNNYILFRTLFNWVTITHEPVVGGETRVNAYSCGNAEMNYSFHSHRCE